MRFTLPNDPLTLAAYLPEFMSLVGVERWMKRADQLADEMDRSPYLHKIVLDYHWLEMCVCHQLQAFSQEGRVDLTAIPELNLAALKFAATTVEISKQLSEKGKRVLIGRILDALKAENGFAALYLELSLTQRLLTWGFDVQLPDMEGTAQFDLLISRGDFSAEVECKSQSADAGRQIHRKHFYRLMAQIGPDGDLGHPGCREIIEVTLVGRLSADLAQQALLADSIKRFIGIHGPQETRKANFQLRKVRFKDVPGVDENMRNSKELQAILNKVFGQNLHVVGWESPDRAYLLVMKSTKEDDPSFVTLEAIRKAASQLSKTRPGFIALQDHGLEPSDLSLPHLQRRVAILSNALFSRYKARHVNAVYVTGYAAVIHDQHTLHTPGFAVANMLARRGIPSDHAEALLSGLLQERPSVGATPN